MQNPTLRRCESVPRKLRFRSTDSVAVGVIRLLIPALLLLGCAKRLDPSLVTDDIAQVRTDDGWILPLRHYPSTGGSGEPVLLMHGMSANHTNWDFRPEVSPVDELLAQGYDVWVPSLRGDQGTVPPSREASSRIGFDDHAIRDVPAILDHIHAATGREQVLWVGHSMGGMLLYTTLVTRPESVRAGIAIASPATFQHPINNHKAMRALGPLVAARRGRLHASGLAGAFVGFRPVVRQLGNPDLLDKHILRGMARHTLTDLPRPTVRQARQWLKEEELCLRDGSPWLAAAPSIDVPMLVLGSPDDHIASERDVAFACEIFPDCSYVLLSEDNGFAADYGHIDPIVGTTAHDEVYPLIFDFLADHRDDPVAATEPGMDSDDTSVVEASAE